MDKQIVVDVEFLSDVSNRINNTSDKITKSIESFQKISDDLGSNQEDVNMKNFNEKFTQYLNSLKNLADYYKNVTNVMCELRDTYENEDNHNARKIRNSAGSIDIISASKGGN